MRRTQLYLPEETHSELLFLAAKEKKVVSQIVREILKEAILRKKQASRGRFLKKLADYGATKGPRDLSSNLDKYLYGEEK